MAGESAASYRLAMQASTNLATLSGRTGEVGSFTGANAMTHAIPAK